MGIRRKNLLSLNLKFSRLDDWIGRICKTVSCPLLIKEKIEMALMKLVNMSYLLICSYTSFNDHSDSAVFSKTPLESKKLPNVLFIGRDFPDGEKIKLSEKDSAEIKLILSRNLAENPSIEEGVFVCPTPHPDLSYLRIEGEKWYFYPPSELLHFTLPPKQLKQFRGFVRKKKASSKN